MRILPDEDALACPRTEDSAVRKDVSAGLTRLKALILLGGSLRPTPLAKAVGRSTLDLPVEPDVSVLQLWRDQIVGLERMLGGRRLDVRLLLDSAAPVPTITAANGETRIEIGRDSEAYRGTAGILRDLALCYEDDDFLLVAGAGQVSGGQVWAWIHL